VGGGAEGEKESSSRLPADPRPVVITGLEVTALIS